MVVNRNKELHVMWLTSIVSHVLLIKCSLPDNWLYDKVMLHLLGATGTARIQS